MAKLITAYCLSCLYCRRLGYGSSLLACHYTYDTGRVRGCDPGDGCTCKVVATDEERELQSRQASSGFVIAGKVRKLEHVYSDYKWGKEY
jgi:hypothetical protein